MLTPMPPNCTRRALGRNVAQILRVELTTGNDGLPRKERYGYNLSCFFFFFIFHAVQECNRNHRGRLWVRHN